MKKLPKNLLTYKWKQNRWNKSHYTFKTKTYKLDRYVPHLNAVITYIITLLYFPAAEQQR